MFRIKSIHETISFLVWPEIVPNCEAKEDIAEKGNILMRILKIDVATYWCIAV